MDNCSDIKSINKIEFAKRNDKSEIYFMQTRVYFTEIKQEIIRNIKGANENIKVAVAWLTDEDIIRTLTQKSEMGVNVQIVISDSKENFRNTTKLKTFLKYQGKLYVTSPKFLHNKFCIIDDNTIINGCYNWTYYAQINEENIMVVSIDKSIKEDSDLLNKFNIKYDYLFDIKQVIERSKSIS